MVILVSISSTAHAGDMQRYQIFITPFEMIFFKISGNTEFVSSGTEATKFFNSISLKEYTPVPEWISYQPPTGGFSILIPHAPSMLHDKMWNNNPAWNMPPRIRKMVTVTW